MKLIEVMDQYKERYIGMIRDREDTEEMKEISKVIDEKYSLLLNSLGKEERMLFESVYLLQLKKGMLELRQVRDESLELGLAFSGKLVELISGDSDDDTENT